MIRMTSGRRYGDEDRGVGPVAAQQGPAEPHDHAGHRIEGESGRRFSGTRAME